MALMNYSARARKSHLAREASSVAKNRSQRLKERAARSRRSAPHPIQKDLILISIEV